jgi:hypothetical protein
MANRYVGSTEDRINKWMRMCLQWQFDIRRGIERKPSHYYIKYHVGKYPKKWFDDLKDSVIDREYVINKMNLISEDRMKRDRGLGINSNRVVIKQIETPNRKAKGIKVDENTIIKEVACATKA